MRRDHILLAEEVHCNLVNQSERILFVGFKQGTEGTTRWVLKLRSIHLQIVFIQELQETLVFIRGSQFLSCDLNKAK
jgi:hypothetical protein